MLTAFGLGTLTPLLLPAWGLWLALAVTAAGVGMMAGLRPKRGKLRFWRF
jgi:hypothetical protein